MPSSKPLVTLRASDDERDAWRAAAQRRGVSFQKWAAKVLTRAAKR